MNSSVHVNGGQTRASVIPLADSATWSTGAPSSPFMGQASVPGTAAQHDGSLLRRPENETSSSPLSFHPSVDTTNDPPLMSELDASNVIHVPPTSEAAAHIAHDRPISVTATQPPLSMPRSPGVQTTQSASYTMTPQLTMREWRGSENTNNDHGMGSGFDRNPSQVFDPTEVPALRHTIKITVTRDGKIVEEALDPYELARLYGQQQAALRSLRGRYDFLAVPDWVRVHPLLGAYLAELVGSFAWVLTLALVSVRNESIFTVTDNTNMTPIPIGFMFTSMVFTFGYISSAHLNPAVSVAVFLVRQMDLPQCFAYILCQLGGAFLAGVVSMVIQGNTDIFVPSVPGNYITSGIFSELVFTFAICLVVLNIAYSRQSGNFFYGFAVGMTITAGSASVGRISGGAFNPAAATGLQVAMCIVSNCDNLKSVWIYWLAPLVGAVAAALLFSQMVQPTDTQVLEDNKVFQDVSLLQKQRMAAQHSTAAAAAPGRDVADETHSETSSTSSSGDPATSTSSASCADSSSSQEMQPVSHTRTPRSRPVPSREEMEEAEEEVNDRHAVVVHTRASPARATTDLRKALVATNNSSLDN